MRRFGRYELLCRLGSGGAANVFLVRDADSVPGHNDGRLLALKVLLPQLTADREALSMFFTEARLAARLDHPNIVKIAGFGRADGVHALAMDYVFGASFGEILAESARANRPLTVGVILRIVSKVAEALHFAHELRDERQQPLRVVHRDVTAQNIMVSFDGAPLLTDFGIAKAIDRGFETRVGVVKGKFAYMSPEQSLGKHIDRRADIFSLGIVLWEALTGEPLFDAPSLFDTLHAIRERPIKLPSQVATGLSPLVDPIVMKALKRPPEERYQSALELHRDIEALIQQAGLKIKPRTIARELAGIYGSKISERAFVLKAAIGGEATSEMLANALGADALQDAHIPLVPGGTSDPDPLGLFTETEGSEPAQAPVELPKIAARSTTEFDHVSMDNLLDNITADAADMDIPDIEEIRKLAQLAPASEPALDLSSIAEEWNDQPTSPGNTTSDLLDLITMADARARKVTTDFKSRFDGALPSIPVKVPTHPRDDDDEIDTLSPGDVRVSNFPQNLQTLPTEAATIEMPHPPVFAEPAPDLQPTDKLPPLPETMELPPESSPTPAAPQQGMSISVGMMVLFAVAFMSAGAAIALALVYL